MSKLVSAILLCIQRLCLGKSAHIGVLSVTRSSLSGYDVSGPAGVIRGLEAHEAAMLLAAAAPPVQAPPVAVVEAPAKPAALLRSVERDGVTFETWIAGRPADRRYAALCRSLGFGQVSKSTTRATGFGDDSTDKVTIRYVPGLASPGSVVPALDAAS